MRTTEERHRSDTEDRELCVSWARPSANPEAARPASVTLQSHPDEWGLLNRLREEVRKRHYSGRTEDAYADWAARFLRFHCQRQS